MYVVEKMAHGYKRTGRAAGGGFYDYSGDEPVLWSGLKTFERRSRQLSAEDVRDRLLHAAVNGALGRMQGQQDASVVSALGPALPLTAGAALALIRAADPERWTARSRELAERFGDRFAPPHDLASRLAAG